MRKPIYTKDHEWRIVSVPNGLWRLQHCPDGVQARGTKTIDPWANHSHAVELSVAQGLLAQHQPQGKAGVA
jgi:hypothetical protein